MYSYSVHMVYSITFNEEKNQLLQASRVVSFEEVVAAISNKKILDNVANPSFSRANQKIYVVNINDYIYAVPYVLNNEKKEIFLKTIYPSRKQTKKYLGGSNEKK